MSDVVSVTAGVPAPGAVPGKVFRSELNPVDFLHRAAYVYPEKVAVVDGGRRYSYRDLAERSWRLANALRSAGLGKGDRVATLLFNSSAMLEAHFGVPAAGGENISSIEVEQAICAHPAVLECAVVGIPHPHWGERPKAFIILNQGATATPQEIIAFCLERLAHYKCPDAIEFGPLPKTSTGKIQKFVLREREWADQDKRISGA